MLPLRSGIRFGWTVLELLVLLAVLVLTLALFLPALGQARQDAQLTACQDNLRQLARAAHQYAADFNGKFFFNTVRNLGPHPRQDLPLAFWYDSERAGRYLPDVKRGPLSILCWDVESKSLVLSEKQAEKHSLYNKYGHLRELVQGVMVCPTYHQIPLDLRTAVNRSYVMNKFAVGLDWILGKDPDAKKHGYFNANSPYLNRLVLFFEGHILPKMRAAADVGGERVPRVMSFAGPRDETGRFKPTRPRFDFSKGIWTAPSGYASLENTLDVDPFTWDLDYSRHTPDYDAFDPRPEGRTNMAFADGHVTVVSHTDLYDAFTGRSTYNVLWSTVDQQVDQAYQEGRFPKEGLYPGLNPEHR